MAKRFSPLSLRTSRLISLNLSVNGDLLAQAKSAGVNLSSVLEHALIAEVKKRKAESWLRDNRDNYRDNYRLLTPE